MRKLDSVHLAAAVAIALSGTAALAQTTSNGATQNSEVSSDSSANSLPTLLEPNQSAGGTGSDTDQTTVDPATTRPSFAGNPGQQSIVIQQQPEARALPTPLLDQPVREAQSRKTQRRIAQQEPRIIGIAPNTDRDLTHQMPDDPIIRY